MVDGGLGIPSFRISLTRLREKRLSKLSQSTEADIHATVTSQTYIIASRRIPGIVNSRAIWKDQLLGTRDGAGLANIGETAHVNSWVTDGTSLMRGAAYIKAIKIRGGILVQELLEAAVKVYLYAMQGVMCERCSRTCFSPVHGLTIPESKGMTG